MTDVNINTTGQAPMWGVGGTDSAQKAQKMKNHGITKDSIEMGTLLKTARAYVQDSNNPSLLPPVPNASNTPPTPQKAPPTYQSLYQEKFASNLDQLANQYGLSKAQVGSMIFKHHNPEQPIDDTFLEGLLTELEGKVAGEMAQEYELPSQKEIVDQGKKHLKNLEQNLSKTEQKFQEAANQLPDGDGKMNIMAFLKTLSKAKAKLKEVGREIEESDQKTYAEIARSMREGALKELEMLKTFLGRGTLQSMMAMSGGGEDAKAIWELAGHFDGDGTKILMGIAALEAFTMGGVVVGLDKVSDTWFEFDIDSGELIPPKGATTTFNKQMTEAYTEAFETGLAALAQKEGLSPEQVAKIRFAHYNPGMGDPSVQGLLTTVEANALLVLGENYSIPKGFKPTIESEKYNHEISSVFSEAVEQALQQYGEENGLTEPQIESMIYLHYHEGADVPNSKELSAIVGKVETEVLGQIAEANGLPSDFKPTPPTFSSDAQMNGEFSIAFEENLRNAGLSTEELAVVRSVIDNPALRSSASSESVQTIDRVWNQSVSDVQGKFGLPVSWAPIGGLTTISGDRTSRNAMIQATEVLGLFRAQIDSMPPSDGKVIYMDMLKVVNEALSSVRKLIAKMKGLDTEVSQKVSQAKLESELKKIEDKASKLKEIEEKMKKMEALKALGPFGDFLKAIFMILLAPIAALTMGPILAGALAGAMVADMAMELSSEDEKGLFVKFFEEIAEAMPDTPLGKLASAMVQLMVIIALVTTGNIVLIQKLLFEDSTALQDLAMAAGATEEQADAFKMAMEMIVMVVEIVASIVLTAGAATGAKAAEAGANVAIKAAETAAKASTKALKAVKAALDAGDDILVNTLKSVAESAQKAANASYKAAKTAQEAVQIGGKTAKTAGEAAAKVAKSTELAAKMATDTVKSSGEALANFAKTASQAAQKSADVAKEMTQVVQKALNAPAKAIEAAYEANSVLAETAPKLAKVQKLVIQLGEKLSKLGKGGVTFEKIQMLQTIVESSAQGITSLSQIPRNVIGAEIALDRGEMEAQDAEVAEMIKLMSKFIKTLYKMLGGYGDWYQQVGNLQQKMWDDKSNVLSKLTQV